MCIRDSFYSKATTDFEFLFPFGWGELWGVADRTDYDLTQHQTVSGKDLTLSLIHIFLQGGVDHMALVGVHGLQGHATAVLLYLGRCV